MEHVLLIDDHPALRRGMGELLVELGWTIAAECGTLAQARPHLLATPWTIAVLDLNLPDGNGMDLLAEIRAKGNRNPVLVHSMMPDAAVAARVLRSGGNGFVNKGSAPEDFQAAAKKVAAGGRYVSPEFAEELAMTLGGGKSTAPHESLSENEYKVMILLAEGKSPGQVAQAIGCATNTISTYRSRILKKLGLTSSMDIMRYALTRRLVNF